MHTDNELRGEFAALAMNREESAALRHIFEEQYREHPELLLRAALISPADIRDKQHVMQRIIESHPKLCHTWPTPNERETGWDQLASKLAELAASHDRNDHLLYRRLVSIPPLTVDALLVDEAIRELQTRPGELFLFIGTAEADEDDAAERQCAPVGARAYDTFAEALESAPIASDAINMDRVVVKLAPMSDTADAMHPDGPHGDTCERTTTYREVIEYRIDGAGRIHRFRILAQRLMPLVSLASIG